MFDVKQAMPPQLSTDNRPAREAPRICDYEGSTYRTDFWEGRGRDYEDRAERIALDHLLPPRGRRVLDVGAGFGRLADLYAGYDEVVLLDYSRSQLEYARARLGDARFIYVAADIYHLPLVDDAVDAAVMVRVLHHLEDVPAALGQIRRVLRNEGAFVLEFANKRHLKNLLRAALGRGPNPFDPRPYQFAELHYDFSPSWVLARLAEAGLQPEARRSVSLFRLGPLKRLVSARALAALDGALQRPTAALAPGPSVFVRSRALGTAGVPLAPLPERAALFRCLACGQAPLAAAPDAVACPACGAQWPIENGVYVLK